MVSEKLYKWQPGRVVKAMDLKSIGQSLRRFESCGCRFPPFSTFEKGGAKVIFPPLGKVEPKYFSTFGKGGAKVIFTKGG